MKHEYQTIAKSSTRFEDLHTLNENLSLFTIDTLKTLTKNYLRKNFPKISKTLVICLKCFMALLQTL